jgi:hypothetical protein
MFKILRGMQTVTDIPITAKFRMGIKDNYPIADRVVPKLEELVRKICYFTASRRLILYIIGNCFRICKLSLLKICIYITNSLLLCDSFMDVLAHKDTPERQIGNTLER